MYSLEGIIRHHTRCDNWLTYRVDKWADLLDNAAGFSGDRYRMVDIWRTAQVDNWNILYQMQAVKFKRDNLSVAQSGQSPRLGSEKS